MDQSFLPANCHLWTGGNPSMEQLRGDLTTLLVYEDDPHRTRALKQCTHCGQLYFYEFYEWIDWENGNDPQYQTWIPVPDAAQAAALNRLASIELTSFTRITSDFPADAQTRSAPVWLIQTKAENCRESGRLF